MFCAGLLSIGHYLLGKKTSAQPVRCETLSSPGLYRATRRPDTITIRRTSLKFNLPQHLARNPEPVIPNHSTPNSAAPNQHRWHLIGCPHYSAGYSTFSLCRHQTLPYVRIAPWTPSSSTAFSSSIRAVISPPTTPSKRSGAILTAGPNPSIRAWSRSPSPSTTSPPETSSEPNPSSRNAALIYPNSPLHSPASISKTCSPS